MNDDCRTLLARFHGLADQVEAAPSTDAAGKSALTAFRLVACGWASDGNAAMLADLIEALRETAARWREAAAKQEGRAA